MAARKAGGSRKASGSRKAAAPRQDAEKRPPRSPEIDATDPSGTKGAGDRPGATERPTPEPGEARGAFYRRLYAWKVEDGRRRMAERAARRG